MKKGYNIRGLIVLVIFFGCSSQKGSISESLNNNSPSIDNTSPKHNNYFAAYKFEDEIFGTKTEVTIVGDKRIMETNSLPNHETGAFPTRGNPNTISAQNKTYTFPMNPKYIGKARWVREPGIALNGVKFEPGTAEVVVCDTGENYRVEAFQDLINLGLDFNHAHVQPTGAYHYHGTPTSVIEDLDTGDDLVHIGFAKDGFPIYFSKSETYKPSYKLIDGYRKGEDCTYTNPKNSIQVTVEDQHDGTYTSDFEYVSGSGDLDACNGITIAGKYIYIVTDTFPYVSRCLMGEIEEEQRQKLRSENERERPTVAQVFEQMDINKDGKLSEKEIKGPLQGNFSRMDTNEDGFLSKEELENVRGGNKRSPRR